MNDERFFVEYLITQFFLKTCEQSPLFTESAVQAAIKCILRATEHPFDDDEADFIPLTTGSVAEFYIKLMLPHVSDIDVMFHWNTHLAIPPGRAPPTQLPAEFHNYVKVFEIIDSHFPGYVYLQFSSF